MGEAQISGRAAPATSSADQFASAYEALKADGSTQFNLPPADPPPETPSWLIAFFKWLGDVLEPVGRFLAWITSFFPDAPYVRVILWVVIAGAAALLVYVVIQRLRTGEWRLPRRRVAANAELIDEEEEESPAFVAKPAWLQEADMLAAQGLFAEAVHHLLFRSIEDIAYRRPQLVKPALTSREIAGAAAIPGKARELFAGIAELVERSLFGGRPLTESDWTGARAAYASCAASGSWRG